MVEKILKKMEKIEYGFPDENGKNIILEDYKKWEEDFPNFYYLQTPKELLKSKMGVCWDQVELERYYFNKENIPIRTYFIMLEEKDMLPSHTFLTYEEKNKFYWFEHAWGEYKGIHEYSTKNDLLKDVIDKFRKSHKEVTKNAQVYLYEYKNPTAHITCDEFYEFVKTSKKRFRRVVCDGKGVYTAWKEKIGSVAWQKLLEDGTLSWLPMPIPYKSNYESYFTFNGYYIFRKKVLPLILEDLGYKVTVEDYYTLENVVYRDEFQAVVEKKK